MYYLLEILIQIKFLLQKNAFEKDFFKLLNNAVFGKTLEYLRKRINPKLTSNDEIYTKLASRAKFICGKMFNENLFAINRIKEELVLNIPIYVGMTILDSSKLLMYDFHFNYMLKKYDRKNIKLEHTIRKLLRIKVTQDLHLTYSKNGGNLGLVLKMKNLDSL